MPLNQRRIAVEYKLFKEEKDLLGKVFDLTPIPIILLNDAFGIIKANESCIELIKAKSVDQFNAWFKANLKKIVKGFTPSDSYVDHEIKSKNLKNKIVYLFVRIKALKNKQTIIILQDITERKLTELRLTRLAQHDGLTGLLNHRTIMKWLDQELKRAKHYRLPLSCILIDVDGFKQVNDQYGHLKGDQLLKKIAKALKVNLRASDLVGRYGGDEFLIVLTQTPLDQALIPARRIQEYLQKDKSIQYKDVRVSFSMGFSGFPAKGIDSSKKLIAIADQSLYKAKQSRHL